MPRDLILRTTPATFKFAEFAEDELALTSLWGCCVLLATILMVGLAAAGGQVSPQAGRRGLNAGSAIAAGCVAGMCIHGIRYVIAQTASRLGERRYRRMTGRSSGMAAALGENVREKRHPILSIILKSTDIDLLAQVAIAIMVLISSQ